MFFLSFFIRVSSFFPFFSFFPLFSLSLLLLPLCSDYLLWWIYISIFVSFFFWRFPFSGYTSTYPFFLKTKMLILISRANTSSRTSERFFYGEGHCHFTLRPPPQKNLKNRGNLLFLILLSFFTFPLHIFSKLETFFCIFF